MIFSSVTTVQAYATKLRRQLSAYHAPNIAWHLSMVPLR
jgi:hypothetical protein